MIGEQMMAEIGLAAARGEDPPPATVARLEELLQAQPLATEPFLVQGAVALRHGETERAEKLLLAARDRSPRSPAARYLLADLYLRTGRALPAMTEMSVLHRLLPQAAIQLAPALAAYARTPGADEQLVKVVQAYPELRPKLLRELATDARNVDLVLLLAERTRAEDERSDWQQALVETLIERGDYRRARDVWERLSGAQTADAGLFNPSFDSSDAPPPFNWQLTKSSGGVAEAGSGGLQVLYYGRADLDLVAQTLLLPPGNYRLAMNIAGNVGDEGSLRWTVTCIGVERTLLDLPLPAGSGSRSAAAEFAVPTGCAAQRLALSAAGREFPKEADFTISGLQLAQAGMR